MGLPAARVTDSTSHGTPLSPGPGCPVVLIKRTSSLAGRSRFSRLSALQRFTAARGRNGGGGKRDGPHRRAVRRAARRHRDRSRWPQCHRSRRTNCDDRMRQIIPNPQKDWLGRGWAYPVNIDPTTGGIALAA